MDVNHLGNRVRSDCSWPSVTSCVSILLVENDHASLVHTASLLQEKLYNVTTAGSAAMALKLLEAHKGFYDIVMADVNMKDMNIFEFVHRIHHQCLTFMPAVILMTEDYNVNLGEEALKNGASFFIEKPLVSSDIAKLWQPILNVTRKIPGAPCHLQEFRGGKSLPSNPLTTPPTRNYVGLTLEGVQQNLHKLHPINALNGTTGNGIMMNTGSRQVAGENEGVQVLMGGPQVTAPNGHHMTGALNVPNPEISGNLGRGICCNENGIIMSTGTSHVAHRDGSVQTFMGAAQVTSTNGYVTDALYVPNQQPLGDLSNGIYHTGNVISNTGSGLVGGEIGEGQILMEGDQVIPTNVCVTGALQEGTGDLGGGIYSSKNVLRNTGSCQVAEELAGVQILMEGDYQNTGQGTAIGPNDIAEYQLTDEDIAEIVRQLHEENTNPTDKAKALPLVAEYQLTDEDIVELVWQLHEENTNLTDKSSSTN